MDNDLQHGTRAVHIARPVGDAVPVNTPVVRTSTVMFDSISALDASIAARAKGERTFVYGRRGSATSFALEDALTDLEGGHRTRLFSSGLAAISSVFLSFLRPGEHALIIDSCYEPVRRFCTSVLAPLGITFDFFHPDGSDVEAKLKPHTRLVWAECPGSVLYEMCDLPALARIVHAQRDVILAVDNTWGSGVLYNPLSLGADVSVIACTKYVGGHSDIMLGAAVANERAWERLSHLSDALGHCVSADDAYLALRGLRTLPARLKLHQAHAMEVAQWLMARREIQTLFFPALETDPGHRLWRRHCLGACGLLSVELRSLDAMEVRAFVDSLALFGIGYSWGGFESLALPVNVKEIRSVRDVSALGNVVRLHIGLEDPRDLIADLEQAMSVFT